jgi:hypothetical protein
MRKLATLALLALSLLTVACTESEDGDTTFEAAEIDEADIEGFDPDTDTLSERARTGAEPAVDSLSGSSTNARPQHAPSTQPASDRVGAAGTVTSTEPGQPGTGTAECMTSTKLTNGEPVVGLASDELGARARIRFEQMTKIRGLR